MAFCASCGSEMIEGAPFCHVCGTAVPASARAGAGGAAATPPGAPITAGSPPARGSSWAKWAALAAIVCVLVGGAAYFKVFGGGAPGGGLGLADRAKVEATADGLQALWAGDQTAARPFIVASAQERILGALNRDSEAAGGSRAWQGDELVFSGANTSGGSAETTELGRLRLEGDSVYASGGTPRVDLLRIDLVSEGGRWLISEVSYNEASAQTPPVAPEWISTADGLRSSP